MVRTIIFDFDGTIANTLPFTWRRIIDYLKKEKVTDRHDEAIIEDIRTKSYSELIKHFKISWLKIPLILFEVSRAQKDLYSVIKTIKPYEDIKETLKELKSKGYKLGILSSNMKESIEEFIELNDLQLFDFIQCKRNLFGKAAELKKIIKTYDLKKNETLYVADEVRDIEACKKVGIKIVSVTWGFNKRELLSKYKPDWIIDKPPELLSLLHS